MSEKEQAKQIIDKLPEYKIKNILLFLQGIAFDDEMEDDLFCERMIENYENAPEEDKEDIPFERVFKRMGLDQNV